MSTSQELNCCENPTAAAESQCATPKHSVRIRPAIDVLEQEHGFVMHVEMPGVEAGAVDVLVERNVLTIRGTAERSIPEGYQPVAGEFRSRVYERSFQLSDDIDRDTLDAEMKNGILTLKLGKSRKALRTSVPVKSA